MTVDEFNGLYQSIPEVVEIAITGHEECAGCAGIALNHLSKKVERQDNRINQFLYRP